MIEIPRAINHTIGLDASVLQSLPILSVVVWLEVHDSVIVNILRPSASVDRSIRFGIFWGVDVAVPNQG